MSLDSVSFSTAVGTLPVSLIGSFLFFIRIILLSPKINFRSIYKNSLLLLGLFFTLISFFIGDSIIGNLSRIWISIFISYFLPNLNISKQTWANSIRKIIFFHFIILVFDLFFETPWGWVGEEGDFSLGFQVPDFYRPSGLFGEPSFYSLTVNSLLLILVILRKSSIYDCIIVLGSNLLATSVSGFLCSVVIILTNYSLEFGPQVKRLVKEGLLNKKIIFSTIISLILLIPLLILNEDFVIKRLSNPLSDSSIIARTVGLWPIIQNVYQNSPFIGFGLGSEAIDNMLGFREIEYIFGTKITSTVANGIVGIFAMGGFSGLTLYLIYICRGLQKRYMVAYFFLLASSGKVFFIFSFVIPAFSKYILNTKKTINQKDNG